MAFEEIKKILSAEKKRRIAVDELDAAIQSLDAIEQSSQDWNKKIAAQKEEAEKLADSNKRKAKILADAQEKADLMLRDANAVACALLDEAKANAVKMTQDAADELSSLKSKISDGKKTLKDIDAKTAEAKLENDAINKAIDASRKKLQGFLG